MKIDTNLSWQYHVNGGGHRVAGTGEGGKGGDMVEEKTMEEVMLVEVVVVVTEEDGQDKGCGLVGRGGWVGRHGGGRAGNDDDDLAEYQKGRGFDWRTLQSNPF